MRLAPLINRLLTLRSLKGRLLLGLSCALAILAGAVLSMAWQVGKTMVHETNMSHLRYEASLLADEITQIAVDTVFVGLVHDLLGAVVRSQQQVPLQVLLAVFVLAVVEDLHQGVVGEVADPAVDPVTDELDPAVACSSLSGHLSG